LVSAFERLETCFGFEAFKHESIAVPKKRSNLTQNTKAGVPPALHLTMPIMPNTDRRNLLRVAFALVALPSTILHFGCASNDDRTPQDAEHSSDHPPTETVETDSTSKGPSMQIQYLEIVTPDVDAVCQTYSAMYGVTFNDADQNLGGARTAKLADGGVLGVRPPMRDTENPVVRPYVLVDNIQASVD